VIASAVASATQYRFELSKDSGATWTPIGLETAPQFSASGLADEQKFHVRVVALNPMHESAAGPSIPFTSRRIRHRRPTGSMLICRMALPKSVGVKCLGSANTGFTHAARTKEISVPSIADSIVSFATSAPAFGLPIPIPMMLLRPRKQASSSIA